MEDHPEGEEELPEEWAPRLVPVVDGVGDAGHDADDVDDEYGGGRDEQGGPFELVQLPELHVVRRLGRDGEVGVDPAEHLEQPLDDGEEVGGDSSDDPELLVPPPLLDADPAPPQLQDARREDGYEKRDEEEAGECANLHDHRQLGKLIIVESRSSHATSSNDTPTVGIMNLSVRRQTAGRVQ